MFHFIKNALQKIYTSVTTRLKSLFGSSTIDEATLKELEIILLSADTGVKTTHTILATLKDQYQQGTLTKGTDLKKALHQILLQILSNHSYHPDKKIFVLVGINGSGKTTVAAKLAYKYVSQGKRVLLVAADTFRAAAQEQLSTWAQKLDVAIVQGNDKQDPSSVIFAGCEQFKQGAYDILIIDTAGRLQTKTNLMNELAKIKRTITKQLAEYSIDTLLTIDSMLGQNSFQQALLFKESTDVSGIILTKMDGTGKGGIIFAIADQLEIPVAYITFGEKPEQLQLFDKDEYIDNLLNT